MRLVSIKNGRDFNYDTSRLVIYESTEETTKEAIHVIRAVENISGAEMQIAKSFNKTEIEGKMREIADAYAKGQKVYFVD